MTATLWILLYAQLVFVLCAAAFGWSSGLDLRHRDQRAARIAAWAEWDARYEAREAQRDEEAQKRRFVQRSRNAALLRHSTERRL